MPSATLFSSIAALALGAAAVATLYALHFLRAQSRRRPVATLIFWQRSLPASQARVLARRRFAHPKTFALLAAIVALLAATLAADRWDRRDAADAVLVIDAGESTRGLAADDRTLLENATRLARSDLDALSGVPKVVAAWNVATVLNASDEPKAALVARLAALRPSPGESASAAALLLAGQVRGVRPDGAIYWYTDHDEVPAGLPDDVRRRVVLRRTAPATSAVAIVGATVRPDGEDVRRVDLIVRLAGRSAGPMTSSLTDATHPDGGASQSVAAIDPDQPVDVTWRGLAADGRTIAVRLNGAPGPPDGHAVTVRLPRRTALRFRYVGDPPAALDAALRSIGTVDDDSADAAGAIAVVANADAAPAGSVAAIRVIDSSASGAGARLPVEVADDPITAGLSLDGVTVRDDADASLPGTPLLTAGGRSVVSLSVDEAVPTLRVDRSLLDASSTFSRRAECPTLISRACATLAGWSDAPVVRTTLRGTLDPLDAIDRRAGTTTVRPPPRIGGSATPPEPIAEAGRAAWRIPWIDAMLGTALTLLTFEGVLLAVRRIV